MKKTKEEILKEFCPTSSGWSSMQVNNVLSAMDAWLAENNKWVPVSEGLPERYSSCNFIVNSNNSSYHGKVYGGTYTGNPENDFDKYEFSTPGIGFTASHWQYSPKSIILPLPPTV